MCGVLEEETGQGVCGGGDGGWGVGGGSWGLAETFLRDTTTHQEQLFSGHFKGVEDKGVEDKRVEEEN